MFFCFLEEKSGNKRDQEESDEVGKAFGKEFLPGKRSFAVTPEHVLPDHRNGETEPSHRNVVEDGARRSTILHARTSNHRNEERCEEGKDELGSVGFPHFWHHFLSKFFLLLFGELIKTEVLHVPFTHGS